MSRPPSMHIRLPERLWADLRSYMAREGLSKQEAVVRLVREALSRPTPAGGPWRDTPDP